ncbi:AsmA family protein [Pseudodesulfovibrio sediminis]|uniref:AsmA domain-containing protein n=1 Tax=Pseudodesulfovibrio sediminis TaxID=2810563 RepID=A0ABN6EMM8_9BACT|nr:AsmA family protein [Pseudodesulfovibrio sediminis]BCS87312.1 hypothetical protein PSDVSF_05540 [Pseudodesulfovibrio sediminis]
MFKRVCTIFIELLAFGVLVIGAVLFAVSFYIDTDDFRNEFTDILEKTSGRHVILNGDIDIALWPDFALEVSELSISEDPDYGDEVFATLKRVSIDISLLPLASNMVEVESIVVDGLEFTLIHSGEGHFNWQSMIQESETNPNSSASAILDDWTFYVHAVEVNDAEINFKDLPTEEEYRLSGISVKTGEIESGQDIPFILFSAFAWADQGIKSDLKLKGVVTLDEDGHAPKLKDATVSASLQFDALPKALQTGEISTSVDMDWEKGTVSLHNFQAQLLGLRAEGHLKSGDLSKKMDVSGHLTVHPFSPAEILAQFAPELSIDRIQGLKSGAVASFFHISEQGVEFKNLVLALDDFTLRGQAGFSGYSDPMFSFDLQGDTLDLEQYLPPKSESAGEPLKWDTFNLPLIAQLKGKGAIRVSGLKTGDELISDIRLKIDTSGASVRLAGSALRKGFSSFTGSADVAIEAAPKNIPVISLTAQLNGQSQAAGFPFFKQKGIQVGGAGTLTVDAGVSKVSCPPGGHVLDILKDLSATVAFSLGQGATRISDEDDEELFKLRYNKASVGLKMRPGEGGTDTSLQKRVTVSVKTRGGQGVEGITFDGEGDISLGVKTGSVKADDVSFSGYVSLSSLPKQAMRVETKGVAAYDSDVGIVEFENTSLRVLETTVTGSAKLTGLDGHFKVNGHLNLDQANPKRIVYLLTDYSIRTDDGEALKKVSMDTDFVVDTDGFALTDFKGSLDGMPFKAEIVGTGFLDPALAVSLSAGAFDLDRYLPPSDKLSVEEIRSGKEKKADPVDLPLAFLRFLNINGRATFQSFKLADIKTLGLNGVIRADKGNIHISKVTGDTYHGKLKGDWTGEVGATSLKTHLILTVTNMNAGLLMVDLASREYIKGETDVELDLTSQGGTDDAILENLGGTAFVRIVDGSYKFTGYNSRPVKGKKETAEQAVARRAKARTAFKKALARFLVEKGVFTAKEFTVEAPPVLQSSGTGNFSLSANTIDMDIRNDFVGVPSVTVELVGKLSDPQVKIPTGKIVNDTVFNILSLPEKSLEFVRDLILH